MTVICNYLEDVIENAWCPSLLTKLNASFTWVVHSRLISSYKFVIHHFMSLPHFKPIKIWILIEIMPSKKPCTLDYIFSLMQRVCAPTWNMESPSCDRDVDISWISVRCNNYDCTNFCFFQKLQWSVLLQIVLNTCTVEWGELGHWCELGQTFSE